MVRARAIADCILAIDKSILTFFARHRGNVACCYRQAADAVDGISPGEVIVVVTDVDVALAVESEVIDRAEVAVEAQSVRVSNR